MGVGVGVSVIRQLTDDPLTGGVCPRSLLPLFNKYYNYWSGPGSKESVTTAISLAHHLLLVRQCAQRSRGFVCVGCGWCMRVCMPAWVPRTCARACLRALNFATIFSLFIVSWFKQSLFTFMKIWTIKIIV